ncbi:conjugal transfer protein TraL [uncultured Caudovirales phage]|uniref:Conjugal transfer protein TraL n=1 Tax=uncultured Caudovirales phage TaxID=2100421 RepID=A0A6J5RCQ5_9CAUD|nr:conjugal transfer protein TraL [uncultured Caudovirales phage]
MEDSQPQEVATVAAPRRRRKIVNLMLAGKGGIGKTLGASLIAQWLREQGEAVAVIDADPVQASLASIASLAAEEVTLLEGELVNVEAMDAVVSRFVTEDRHFVVDCGASGFRPFSRYLLRDELIAVVAGNGKRVLLHTVIAGGAGDAMTHTAVAVSHVLDSFLPHVEVVVWLNPFFGELSHNGVPIEETTFFDSIRGRIAAIIRLPLLDPNYSGATFARMLKDKLTFEDVRMSQDIGMITKLRLANVWKTIKDQLTQVMG